MYALSVQIEVAPEHRDDFAAAALAHARNSLTEPGCVAFEIFSDPEKPHRFYFHEVYQDKAAIEAHGTMPYFIAFGQKIGGWIRSKSIHTWEKVSH